MILVLIPTLARPRMIVRAVKSVQAQAYIEWRCVIVKNGDPSSIPEYVNRLGHILADERVSLLIAPYAGLGYALTYGLKRSLRPEDRWVAVLEDDDEWDPNFLRTMSCRTDDPQAVVHCLQRQEPCRKQGNGGPMDKRAIKSHNWINLPMCLFSAELLHDFEFDNKARVAVDWDTHLRLLQRGARYYYVDKELVTHYWHGDNYCLRGEGKESKEYVLRRVNQGEYA